MLWFQNEITTKELEKFQNFVFAVFAFNIFLLFAFALNAKRFVNACVPPLLLLLAAVYRTSELQIGIPDFKILQYDGSRW